MAPETFRQGAWVGRADHRCGALPESAHGGQPQRVALAFRPGGHGATVRVLQREFTGLNDSYAAGRSR
jgi:hypothetical protein